MPSSLDFQTAAAAMLQGMTAHYLTHSTFQLKPGDTALVHAAAGGTGLLIVQMAKMRGAQVIGTASHQPRPSLREGRAPTRSSSYTREGFRGRGEDRLPGAKVSMSSTTRSGRPRS